MERLPELNLNNEEGFKSDAETSEFFARNEEVIVLKSLSEEDLEKIFSLKQFMTENKPENSKYLPDLMDKIADFGKRLEQKYDRKTLSNCAFFSILIGSTLDSDAERLDLEPEDGSEMGPIENFIRNELFKDLKD